MSQRRPKTISGAASIASVGVSTTTSSMAAVVPPASFSLDGNENSEDLNSLDDMTGNAAVAESVQVHMTRLKKWKESAFAVALTEPTWEAEAQKLSWTGERSYHRLNGRTIVPTEDEDDLTEMDLHPDTTGCLCCSALICPYLGAGRVGNMCILHSTTERIEEVDEDLETGEVKTRRFTRPKLLCVLGPYWPMLLFVTYPLIFTVSGWAFMVSIYPGNKPFVVVAAWVLLTGGLIGALGLTGCRDPGILYRQAQAPPQNENAWRWNDQAQTYRPRGAHFDADTGVIIEEFDHTCPWTGTAIGKRNMLSFQFFVCLVFICLIMDIFLITGAF
mmetsp:Transcript_8761/g.11631  ORF Transcript_8761/g.11631 Transcript_8761/m.11631 type:complete len:331 (-) Transcript_8761:234-1226(-)